MQSFFLAISNFISTAWEWISSMFKSFFALLDYLTDSVTFVVTCLGRLPDLVRVPCTIILGVMIIKFILSFGKQ